MPIPLTRLDICLYCGDPATEKEHLFPNSVMKALDNLGIMQYEFLTGTCYRCNRIAGAHVFSHVGDKIDYVQRELKRRGVWLIPTVPDRIRNVSIVGRGWWDDSHGSVLAGIKAHSGIESEKELLQALIAAKLVRPCSRCLGYFITRSRAKRVFCSNSCRRFKGLRNAVIMGHI